MNTWAVTGTEGRRRSQRVVLNIPITVTGQTAKGEFTEQTQTLVINAHGALILLAAKLTQGQKMDVKSVTNPAAQQCSVVYVGPTVDGKTQYGVEFTKAAPKFWQIAFPPEDWTPAMLEDPPSSKTTPPRKGTKTPA